MEKAARESEVPLSVLCIFIIFVMSLQDFENGKYVWIQFFRLRQLGKYLVKTLVGRSEKIR